MHPEDLENYNCTPTERKMYVELRDQLAPKYQVFFSIRWFETNEENKRVDSECDFLIFDPSFGFLTIEVKGGENIEIENGKWILTEYVDGKGLSRRELKCSPYEQSEKSISLIDGELLTKLMIKYKVGVRVIHSFDIFSIDVY